MSRDKDAVPENQTRPADATADSVGTLNGLDRWFSPMRFGLFLLGFLFAQFPRVMLGQHGFSYRDYGVLGYPFIFYARESFWRGELPLWNPLSNCGAPFLAQWGTMVLYPFSLLYLLFPLPWSLSYFCLAHLWWGGLGMFFLARRWTGRPFAGCVAGLAWVFNGVTFSCLLWPNYTVALGWMPWVMLCTERSWQEGGRWLVAAAIVGALQMLSGVPEVVLQTWLVVGAMWLAQTLGAAGERGRRIGRLAVVVALVAGLTAVQLLPFLELLANSNRSESFTSTKWAMPAWGWANLLVPLFHCFRTPQGPYFQHGQAFLSSYYLGVGVLALAVWAAWRVRERRVWVLAALTVFSLTLALGENGPLLGWLKRGVPLLGIVRFPIKFVVLAAFCVPLLAAYAAAALENGSGPQRGRRGSLAAVGGLILALTGVVLWFAGRYPFQYDQWAATWHNGLARMLFLGLMLGVCVLLAGDLRAAWRLAARALLLLLMGLDVITHTADQNPTLPVALFEPGLWQQHHPAPPPRLGESRAMLSVEAEKQMLHNAVADPVHQFLGKRLALWSNLNLLDGIPKVNGSSTLQVKYQKRVEELLYPPAGSPATNTTTPDGLVDLLAVSHVSKPGSVTEWASRVGACPMVTLGQAPEFVSDEEALRRLVARDFEPRRIVLLPLEARTNLSVSGPGEGRILASRFSAHRVSLAVETAGPAVVVLAQSFYPCWRATVDGAPARLWRANYAFQALEVPAGRHDVTLSYRDGRCRWGAVVSAVSTVLCGLMLWRLPRRAASGD